jgi:hypothetical protein
MSNDVIKEAEAIRKEVAAHQIATFGHVVTQEELDADEAEWKEERRKKFEGLTDSEVAALQDRETREWLEKMKKNGYDEDKEESDENLSYEEKQKQVVRHVAAFSKTLHDDLMEEKALKQPQTM